MVVKKYENEESGVKIEIDEEKCIGAGECVKACGSGVFELVDGKAHAVKVEDCSECCLCVDSCPTGAITHSSC